MPRDLVESVVVVGSANVDVVCRVERLPVPGETAIAVERRVGAGGKGANQAAAAARSGAVTALVCALGDDAEGRLLRGELDAAGVRVRARRSAAPTGSAYITVDDRGENSIVVSPGANDALGGLRPDEAAAISLASVLLLQLETPIETAGAAARTARSAGALVILNAAPYRDLPGELLDAVDILIVNEHEAAQLDAAHRRGGAGSPRLATVTTLGGDGVRITGDGFREELRAQRAEVVDTTGAGDTFCGAFAAALVEASALERHRPGADDLVGAALYAMTAATLSVQRAGALPSIPTRAEIESAVARRAADPVAVRGSR